MFEGLSNQEIFLVICALLFGFGLVKLIITGKDEVNISDSEERKSNENTEQKKSVEWFDTLDISPNATLDEIKSAYKRKISQYHPDKVASLGPEFILIAEEKTKRINASYEEALKNFK